MLGERTRGLHVMSNRRVDLPDPQKHTWVGGLMLWCWSLVRSLLTLSNTLIGLSFGLAGAEVGCGTMGGCVCDGSRFSSSGCVCFLQITPIGVGSMRRSNIRNPFFFFVQVELRLRIMSLYIV